MQASVMQQRVKPAAVTGRRVTLSVTAMHAPCSSGTPQASAMERVGAAAAAVLTSAVLLLGQPAGQFICASNS
jgi:hypothetical protein